MIARKTETHSKNIPLLSTDQANQTGTESNLPLIIIDAGHGGEDGGTIGVNGVYEKDLNLDIAFHLNDILRAAGFPTQMTRTEDILLYDRNVNYQGRKKVLDLAARLKIARSHPDAIFISIHMNAFPQSQYHGLQVYYSPNSPESQKLAESVQTITKQLILQDNERKIKPSGGKIYLLDRMGNPSILIECGFLSNAKECEALSDVSYRKSLAFAIFAAIQNYVDANQINPVEAP